METLIQQLAEQGILALLLALSIAGNIFLYKEKSAVNEKRIQEAIETRNAIMEPLKAIQTTVEIILKSVIVK